MDTNTVALDTITQTDAAEPPKVWAHRSATDVVAARNTDAAMRRLVGACHAATSCEDTAATLILAIWSDLGEAPTMDELDALTTRSQTDDSRERIAAWLDGPRDTPQPRAVHRSPLEIEANRIRKALSREDTNRSSGSELVTASTDAIGDTITLAQIGNAITATTICTDAIDPDAIDPDADPLTAADRIDVANLAAAHGKPVALAALAATRPDMTPRDAARVVGSAASPAAARKAWQRGRERLASDGAAWTAAVDFVGRGARVFAEPITYRAPLNRALAAIRTARVHRERLTAARDYRAAWRGDRVPRGWRLRPRVARTA